MSKQLLFFSFKRWLLVSAIFTLGCGQKEYEVKPAPNAPAYRNTAFASYEDISSPRFQALREKYRLDSLFGNETDELKRILLMRHWIHKAIPIDDYGPYAGDGSVEATLQAATTGRGFHCGYFMAVQNALLNAYGYVTRCLLADTGVPVDYMVGGGHHAINEVWLNSYHKWFLSDAKYDYHFEKDGIPLSALEIRDEYLKNKAADIVLVKGPDRVAVAGLPEYNINTKEDLARVYTWLSWDKYNNRYASWPNNESDLIMYEDEYFKTHTWLWDGKPHWAYNTKFMHLVQDKNIIDWTPNTITAKITLNEGKAKIDLASETPNFLTYQMKDAAEDNSEWEDITGTAEIPLSKDRYELLFRTKNTAGITGPEYKVLIGSK